MKWDQVRETYPNKWVIVEAIKAHSEDNQRIVEDLSVYGEYENSMDALKKHAEMHKQLPNREFYFFHTSRERLDIIEKKWTGLRRI